jgi:peptidoglycan/LPS O-acetylase OafA/YrhL
MKSVGQPTSGYLTVDMMRFLAALTVVWNHAWNLFAPSLEEIHGFWRLVYQSAGFGPDAVRVFFVISGYWITASIMRKIDAGSWTWPSYLIDRLSRLGIVLVPVLVIGLVLDLSARYLFNFPRYSDFDFIALQNYDLAERMTPQAFFGNLVFLQNIYVPPFGSNLPLWSLANEFWYYVWFPAFFLVFRRKISVMTLLSVVTIVLFIQTNVAEGFPIWLLGSLIYVVTQRLGARFHGTNKTMRYGAVSAGMAVFLASLAYTHIYPISWMADGMIEGVAFSLLMIAVIAFNVGIPRLLHPLATYGAEASFSLYLLHFPVMLFVASVLTGGQVFPPGPLALALALGMSAFLIAVAWAFSRVTEKHTGWMRRRLTALLARLHAPREKSGGAGA